MGSSESHHTTPFSPHGISTERIEMQENQYPFPQESTLTQIFFVAFMQAATTELAKYAAVEMVKELTESDRRRGKRRKVR